MQNAKLWCAFGTGIKKDTRALMALKALRALSSLVALPKTDAPVTSCHPL